MRIADQRARLHLAFWGMLHFKNSEANVASRKNLFDTRTPKDGEDPNIAKAWRTAAWQKAYVKRLVDDGILKQMKDREALVYAIADTARVNIMLDDVEGMGAERFGWYLAPKSVPYPWKDTPEPDEIEEIDDEFLDKERGPQAPPEEEEDPDTKKRSYGELLTHQMKIQRKMLDLLLSMNESQAKSAEMLTRTMGNVSNAVGNLNVSVRELSEKVDTVTDGHLSKVVETAASALGPLVSKELEEAVKALTESTSAAKGTLEVVEHILASQEAAQKDRIGSVAKVLLDKAEDLSSRANDLKAAGEVLVDHIGSDGDDT